MLNERFAKRFNELEAEFRAIPYNNDYAAAGVWEKWATSAESLLLAACKENSPHYTNFVKSLETSSNYRSEIESLGGIFLSAKEAFEANYLFDVERDVSAEIFGDFVVLARRALAENNKEPIMPTCFAIQPFDSGKFEKRFDDIYRSVFEETGLGQ